MRNLKCWIKGHDWLATKWINDDVLGTDYIVYCTRCDKKKEKTNA